MFCPSVSSRVRMNGRDGEFIIVRVYHHTSVVDLCTLAGDTDIERNVPFDQLSLPGETLRADPDREDGDRLAKTLDLLRASRQQLASSYASLADLHELLQSTQHVIQTTQARILESDRIIGRARCGVFPGDHAKT